MEPCSRAPRSRSFRRPRAPELGLSTERRRCNERPTATARAQPPLAATREKPALQRRPSTAKIHGLIQLKNNRTGQGAAAPFVWGSPGHPRCCGPSCLDTSPMEYQSCQFSIGRDVKMTYSKALCCKGTLNTGSRPPGGAEGPGGDAGEAGRVGPGSSFPCARSPRCRGFTHKPKRT